MKILGSRLTMVLKALTIVSLISNMYVYNIQGLRPYYDLEILIRLIIDTIIFIMMIIHSYKFKSAYLEYSFRHSGIECSDDRIIKDTVSRSSGSKLNNYLGLNCIYATITLCLSVFIFGRTTNVLTVSRVLFILAVIQTLYMIILCKYEEILTARLKREKEIKETLKEVK